MRKTLTFLLAALAALTATAQEYRHPVAFEIAGEKIPTAEVKREFLKSMGKNLDKNTGAATRQQLNDYADLYLNYRIKLKDAYQMGLDTDAYLNRELKRYRKDLAAPYLIDSISMQRLLREAYDRNHYTLHAYHILCACEAGATLEDTLKAYNKAMEVYRRVTTGGEDFNEVARELSRAELQSNFETRSLEQEPYDGDLPYFTVFNMVYPFENAAYSLQVGEVSKPVRSQYGYHVIKLVDKVRYFGQSSLQHIWVSNKEDSNAARNKIYEAYTQIQQGQPFSLVCRNYSEDRSTAENGGLLPQMTMDQLPGEYLHALAGLKEGEYTQPFHTQYGWHIVYCVSKEQIPPFEDMVPTYKQRMTRDAQRSRVSQHAFAQQRLKQYGWEDYTTQYDTIRQGKKIQLRPKADLKEAESYFTDSTLRIQWKYIPRPGAHDERPILRVGKENYTNDDFLKFIAQNHSVMVHCDPPTFIADRYKAFIDNCAIQQADSRLEQEVPEFGELIDEYRNGLMIFAYNDKMIWGKAIQDTLGFRNFYESESRKKQASNPEDSSYFWNLRAQVYTVYVPDSTCLSAKKARKVIDKQLKNSTTASQLKQALEEKLDKNCHSEHPVQVGEQQVEKNNQNLLADNEWQLGTYHQSTKTGYRLLVVYELINPTLKNMVDSRGYYMNDYQNRLETELLQRLKEQYQVKKYQEAIDEISF